MAQENLRTNNTVFVQKFLCFCPNLSKRLAAMVANTGRTTNHSYMFPYCTSYRPEKCVKTRGGHRHWQVGRMPDIDLKRDLQSKGVKDHPFFKKPKAKIAPSTAIVVDHNVYGSFQCKKTSCLLTLPSQRS